MLGVSIFLIVGSFKQPQSIYVQGFRYFNVYGKYMHLRGKRANAIHKWREQARKQGYIEVWDIADKVKRDWTWVGDVCRLHIDFIKTVKGSGIWNVGSGLPHSFLDIAEYIAEQEGVELRTVDCTPRRARTYALDYLCRPDSPK